MPDVVVIGGGMAGISVAAELAAGCRVVLVERESMLTYHTTGRSAALYFENYGHPASRPFTSVGRQFFLDPPDGSGSLLSERGALYVARDDQLHALAIIAAEDDGGRLESIDAAAILELQPVMLPGYAAGGLYDANAMDIDVARAHQALVRLFKERGGRIDTSAPVVAMEPALNGWTIETRTESHSATVTVNATGAWGDVVAQMAGVGQVGLVPKRRTAFMVAGAQSHARTPLTADADFGFYFKPDGVQYLCSLAEEEPEEPCDAQPREIDVALAIERINAATTLEIRHVASSWTGQRTFAPDEAPVVGFDPDHEGFFWLVGQGGVGIQSSPGAARYAAAMILDGEPPSDLVTLGLDISAVSPARLRN